MPAPAPAKQAERRRGLAVNAVLSVFLALLGWGALQWRELLWPRHGDTAIDWSQLGLDWLQRTSYDAPFVLRGALPGPLAALAGPARPTGEVVIVYMDEESTRELGQTPGAPWDRALHARLLERLTRERARAVLFDVIFDSDAPADDAFAAAIRAHGNVFLGAAFSTNQQAPLAGERAQQAGLATEQLTRRNRTLYAAARGWGLLTFRPLESDYGVTRIFAGKPRDGFEPWPAATWRLAQALGANLPEDPATRFAPRWINYYGPARSLESVSYYRALGGEGGAPEGFFRDRLVLVGARSQLHAGTDKLLDEFSTPWSRLRGRVYTPGTEVHATILLNLLRHEWLRRVPAGAEAAFVIGFGLALGALRWLRPWRILAAATALAVLLLGAACVAQWRAGVWGNWAVPVLVQLPAAVVLAVASRYYLEEARKRALRRAFGFYLSPKIADQIADEDFTLAPGGKKVIATLVFTDLEGFTTLSEQLGDSAELGRVLTDYFTRTTDEILQEDGTVIKFVGDAVYAVWGAPVPQEDHAVRAVRAAWRLTQVSALRIPVRKPDGTTVEVAVRTRVGIHTGEALAGNLGSARRFDYTLIGDAVNFASRLEGLNKYTRTAILASDETVARVGDAFLFRRVGRFRVAGKSAVVGVHELLGERPAERPAWLETFATALAAWERGDLAEADVGFQAVVAARGGHDGPSELYLSRLAGSRPGFGWDGSIVLGEK